jgi:cystathionine beta-synthase
MSAEKIKTLRAFGARVVVTPTAVGPTDPRSHYSVSERIAEETPNAYLANQYHNLANREAHYNTTGPEIWEQTGGQVDVFVAGMGTGGTITGVGMYLKEKKPSVQIVGADPVGSILHDYFKTGTMPTPQSYKVEGIGEDMLPANLDFKILDEIVQVTDQESFGMTRKLLLQEGLFIGPSCGAAVVAAVKYAKTLKEPKTIVVVLPDSGGRYLSKVYDDDWMRENGFLEPDDLGQVRDLVNTVGAIQPITATAEHTVGMVIDIMRDKGISQLPVVKAGKVVGIVAEADVLKALVDGRVQKDSSVAPLVGFGFAVVSLDDPVSLVSAHVSEGKMPILMVNGEVKSIITKIDLITYLGRRR